MKAFSLWVSLVLLLVACESTRQRSVANSASEVHDASTTSVVGTNVRLQPPSGNQSFACLDPKQKVDLIDVNGELLTHQNVIAVPKNIHAFSSYLSAMPYSEDGDEMNFDYQLVWGVANKKIATITPRTPDHSMVEVIALQDFFDTDGYEPQTVAGVCAIDPCNEQPTVYPQPGCAGFTIVGLINLEGTWLIQGSMFSEPQKIAFTQTGRKVVATPLLADQSKAELTNNVLRFHANHYQYICTFTSRTHCDGKRIDVQTGIVVGWWVADRQ